MTFHIDLHIFRGCSWLPGRRWSSPGSGPAVTAHGGPLSPPTPSRSGPGGPAGTFINTHNDDYINNENGRTTK